jgi:hypothetical protein
MSLEMAHKVILPPQKNYIPQFLKQRDINSYYAPVGTCSKSLAKFGWLSQNGGGQNSLVISVSRPLPVE